ncbi:MAG: transmembrane 220 family protein [Ignavibacteriae bacterium]|nr:transmembrane 220 family protein [Ignavibacteriota bacterium]MCB9215529.1 transmembrane 220 family protein [Ignavibacteria bacterium]
MRFVYITVAIIFTSFAAVQYNDPDAGVWIAAYLFAALVTLPPIFGKHTPLPAIGLAIYLVWGIALLSAVDVNWIEIEEARESFGLLLAAFWMGVLLYLWVRRRSAHSQSEEADLSP